MNTASPSVGIDMAGPGGLPKTMAAYEMQGTPTLILIDRQGRRRGQYFGQVPDLRLGHDIGSCFQSRGLATTSKAL